MQVLGKGIWRQCLAQDGVDDRGVRVSVDHTGHGEHLQHVHLLCTEEKYVSIGHED